MIRFFGKGIILSPDTYFCRCAQTLSKGKGSVASLLAGPRWHLRVPFCRGRGDAVLYFMEEWLYLCTLLQKALERGWREEENVDVNVMHPSDSQTSQL